MQVTVFGLGYVGLVTSLCLESRGHDVTGVDVSGDKVRSLERGALPLVEPQLAELFAAARSRKRFRATLELKGALDHADVALIAVPTPSRDNGVVDLKYVHGVVEQIVNALPPREEPLAVAIRSTIPPGTSEECQYLADRLRRNAVTIYHVPEFLREGSAVSDFFAPPLTVVGSRAAGTSEPLTQLFRYGEGPSYSVDWRSAEMMKYVCNCYHALKVAFANEIGRLCNALNIDGGKVMEMACADTKLNVSKAYLRPGFAYGGSCLPKDLRAVVAEGRYGGQSLPTIESVARSNSEHIAHAGRIIRGLLPSGRGARVLVCGLTFKEDTDDLRESPVIELVERLLRSGCKVRVYDPLVTIDRLIGTNLLYQRTHVPDLSDLLAEDLDAEIAAADVVVYYHGADSVVTALTSAAATCPVVDVGNRLRGRIPAPRYYSII
ncbi:MAG: hypothetical protein RL033_4476 [Pseudomonadota bacterium]|jgi:GDP-mannose 6-dehydrogenase